MQKYDFQNNLGFTLNKTAKAFLEALDSDQDGLTQKEIAKRLGLEGRTLIPIIDKMEKDDIVVRKVDPSDRQNNRIYRTDKADKLSDEMAICALKISLRNIPKDDIDIANNVLENIYQNLRKRFDVGCNIGNHDALVDLSAGMGHNNPNSFSITAIQ